MIRVRLLSLTFVTALLASCDRSEPPVVETGLEPVVDSADDEETLVLGGLKMKPKERPLRQKGWADRSKKFSGRIHNAEGTGMAVAAIQRDGQIDIEILDGDGETRRFVKAATLDLWVREDGDSKPRYVKLHGTKVKSKGGCSRFSSKKGTIEVGKSLRLLVCLEEDGKSEKFNFKVPADYVPF